MENSSILGGGILFALLALLWVAVLAPSFARGREFRAAEQNAARLQRTLRILAETAEVPEEHIVEANAREALAHEKKLKSSQKHQENMRRQELQRLRAEQRAQEVQKQSELKQQQALLRKERLRSAKFKPLRKTAAAVALLGTIGMVVGLVLLIVGNGPILLFSSLAATGVSITTLVKLAPGAKKSVHKQVKPVHTFLPELEVTADEKTETVAEEEPDTSHEDHLRAQAEAAAEIEKAKALARIRAEARARALAEKEAKRNMTGSMILTDKPKQEQPRKEAPKPQTAFSKRLQSMGIVEDTQTVDVEEMLKKRRNAG